MSETRPRLGRTALLSCAVICTLGGLPGCATNTPAPVTFYNAGRLTNADAQVRPADGASEAQASADPGVSTVPTPRVERQSLDVTSSDLPPPAGASPQSSGAPQSLVLPSPAESAPALKQASAASAPQALVIVKPGDTLYSIARVTGVERAALAAENDLAPPFALKPGMRLKLPRAASLAAARAPKAAAGGPLLKLGENPLPPAAAANADDLPMPDYVSVPSPKGFIWPVKGRVVADFGLQRQGHTNDGIDIAVPEGTPVVAARGGEVIYTGNELKGYGNLVLIRHEDGYVSAYAHNSRLIVKRGDKVRQGQHIADSGQSGNASVPVVHFELRKDRKPVNPQGYLPRT